MTRPHAGRHGVGLARAYSCLFFRGGSSLAGLGGGDEGGPVFARTAVPPSAQLDRGNA